MSSMHPSQEREVALEIERHLGALARIFEIASAPSILCLAQGRRLVEWVRGRQVWPREPVVGGVDRAVMSKAGARAKRVWAGPFG